MRRAAILATTLAAFSLLGGCASTSGEGREETSLIVANLTSQPIRVSYAQDPANTKVKPLRLDQQVLPHDSIRFTGKERDRLTVTAGTVPPMVVEYSQRSQVLHVSGDGAAVTYDLRKGQTDPTANPPR